MKGNVGVWKQIGDIREENCSDYEGRFFPYLDYSATGRAFVLQLFFVFLLSLSMCVSVCVHAPIRVVASASDLHLPMHVCVSSL